MRAPSGNERPKSLSVIQGKTAALIRGLARLPEHSGASSVTCSYCRIFLKRIQPQTRVIGKAFGGVAVIIVGSCMTLAVAR